jgi:hypothetical protein
MPTNQSNYRRRRRQDFNRRAQLAPDDVYYHAEMQWPYIPIHPFADETDILTALGLHAEMCREVDGWWLINDDMILLQVAAVGGLSGNELGLFASLSDRKEGRISLMAVIESTQVSRLDFERCMSQFTQFMIADSLVMQLPVENRYIKIG